MTTRSPTLATQLMVPSPHVTQPAIVQELHSVELAVGSKRLNRWPTSLSKRTCTLGIQHSTLTIGDDSPLLPWKVTLKKKKIVACRHEIHLRRQTTSITETVIYLEARGIFQAEEADCPPSLSLN